MDFKNYSDEELRQIAGWDSAPRVAQSPNQNYFDRYNDNQSNLSRYSDDELKELAGWKKPQQTGPRSFDLSATVNDFGTNMKDFGIGSLAGVGNVADAGAKLANPFRITEWLPGLARQAYTGLGGNPQHVESWQNFENPLGQLTNPGAVKQELTDVGYKPDNQTAFDWGELFGESVALPGAGAGGFGLKTGIKLGALEGGLGAGFMEFGEQAQKDKYDPARLGQSVALGTGFGAAGGAGAHYMNELLGRFFGNKADDVAAKLDGVTEAVQPTQPAQPPIMNPVEGADPVYSDMLKRGLIDRQYLDDDDLQALIDLGLVAEKPRMRMTAEQAATGLIERLAPEPKASPIETLTPKTVTRRFSRGNTGEAVTVDFPDELSARINDLGSQSRRTMTGDRSSFDKQRTNELQKQIAEELGIDPAEAGSIARQFNKIVREQAFTGQERVQAPNVRDFIEQIKPRTKLSQEQVSDPSNLIGDIRHQLSRDAAGNEILGHARGSEGVDLDAITADVLGDTDRALVRQLAERQLALKTAQEHEGALAQKLQEMGIDEMDLDGYLYKINERRPELKLDREGQKLADAARFEHADALSDPIGGGPRATVSKEALARILESAPQPTGDQAKDAALLKRVYEGRLKANREYEAAKKAMYVNDEGILERVERGMKATDPQAKFHANVDVNGSRVGVENVKPRIEKRFEWDAWKKIASKELKDADDATINARMKTHFEDLARKHGRTADEWADVAAEAEERSIKFQDELREIKDMYQYEKPRKPSVTRKKAPVVTSKGISNALIGGGIAYEAANQSAFAADDTVGDKLERRSPGLSRVGLGLVVAGAAMRAKPAMVNKLLKSGAAKASYLLGDTLDHVGRLDEMVDAAGKRMFVREGQKGLAQEILDHNASVLKARMGVKFESQQMIETAREQLIRKKLTASQALNGKAGTAFEKMTKEQRNAIVTEYLGRKTLAGKVRKQYEKVSQWFKSLDLKEQAKHKAAMMHINSLNAALNSPMQTDIFAGALGNTMNFYFQANPAFHALNLTDSIIAGGSRIGPVKMARAWKMLGADKEIKELFKNSNIIGGVKAETNAWTGQAKTNAKVLNADKTFDFGSDSFNADRVALASFLQSFDAAAAKGVKAEEKTFLKAIVKNEPIGDVTQEIIDDAWVQMADHGLRILNVDPYRINRNIVTTIPGAHYFAAFVNQPARIARMANEFVANGDYRKLGVMLGLTAAIGGKAAIPVTMRQAAEFLDPEAAFAVEATLDDMSIPSLLTGGLQQLTDDDGDRFIEGLMRDVSRKLEWDPFYMLMGSGHPGIEAARDAGQTLTDSGYSLIDALAPEADMQARVDAGYKAGKNLLGLAGRTAVSNVKGVPVGVIDRAVKAAKQSYDGKVPIYHYDGDKPYAGKTELNLDDIPAGRFLPFFDMLAPGDSSLIAREQAAKKEAAKKKKRKVENDRAAYMDPLRALGGK